MSKFGSLKNPLISIIILAGPNRRDELIRNINSIFQSSYKNYEVIVINNSGDPSLLEFIKIKFPSVKTIDLIQNTGIYGFNVGFANASGDYILGIDDDCGLRKDTLFNVTKIFETKPKEVLLITSNIYNPLYNYYYEEAKKDIINRYSFADGATVFKKEAFKKIGYYDSDFFCWQHSDDYSIRLLNKGYKINFAPEIIIDHYEQKRGLRKNRAYLDLRNSAWFNLKHFSLFFLPILIIRNLISLLRLPFRHKSALALLYGLSGYITGWLTLYIPLKKRSVVSFDLQIKFLKYYLINQHPED